MKKYVIWHDRPECTACGACAAVTDNWFMDEQDALASVVKDEISEEEKEINEEAAIVCPVNIIHIAEPGMVPEYFREKGITERPNPRRE